MRAKAKMLQDSNIYQTSYSEKLACRLAETVKNKHSDAFKLFGPGAWLLFTQVVNSDQLEHETRTVNANDMVYAPYKALYSYVIPTERIDQVKNEASRRKMFIICVNARPSIETTGNYQSVGTSFESAVTYFTFTSNHT